MKNNKFFRTLAVALIATMTLSIPTVAGTNNLGDGSGVEVDFDFDFSEPDKTELEETTYTIDLTNTLKVTEKLSKLFIDNNSNDSPKPSGNGFKDSVDTNKMGTIEATYNHSYRQHDMSSTSDTDEYTNSNNAFLPQTGDNVSLSRLLIVSSLSLLTMIFIHRKRRS